LLSNEDSAIIEASKTIVCLCNHNSENCYYICRSTDTVYNLIAKLKESDARRKSLAENVINAIRAIIHGAQLLPRIKFLDITKEGFIESGLIGAVLPYIEAGFHDGELLIAELESAMPQQVQKAKQAYVNEKENKESKEKKQSKRRYVKFYEDEDSDRENNMKFLTIEKTVDYDSEGSSDEDITDTFWPGPERTAAYVNLKKNSAEIRKSEHNKKINEVHYLQRPSYLIAPVMTAPDPRLYSSHYYGAGNNSKIADILTTNPLDKLK